MSEKRRDHRGRILHNGEIQLSDGRYRFKYVDEMGKERCVYSWRLDHSDATPKGMLMCGKVTHKNLIDSSLYSVKKVLTHIRNRIYNIYEIGY